MPAFPDFSSNHYPYFSRRSAVYARRGMVATSQPLAARAISTNSAVPSRPTAT